MTSETDINLLFLFKNLIDILQVLKSIFSNTNLVKKYFHT